MSKVYIFGAGPTGLTLAWIYSQKGFQVTVYERWKAAGGSWAAKWTEDGEFTHHSPQILSTAYVNTFRIWNEMGIDKSKFLQPYKSSWRDAINMNTRELLLMAVAYLKYATGVLENTTVQEYFKSSNLSKEAEKSLVDLCYLVDGVPPSKMTMDEIFGVFDQTFFYSTMEMKEASDSPNGFATLVQQRLEENGVKFVFNASLYDLSYTAGRIHATGRMTYDKKERFLVTATGDDHVILTMDPSSLINVINRSDSKIQNNWGIDLTDFLADGVYYSLSIQFHFDEPWLPELSEATKRGSSTPWGIICVQVPDTIAPSSLTSTILNLSHVRGLEPEQIKIEAWRQIKEANPYFPEPSNITFGIGSTFDGEWNFDMSAAVRTTQGSLTPTGDIKNLHIVGPVNDRRFKATTMEAAVESAILFSGDSVKQSVTLSAVIIFFIVITIVFATAIMVAKN